ncbi:putative signal recognition particle 54 kDa protein SRP54 [Gregarina niphandrodes]|uniref:signal-recognition-particle GTPase n=1 Tax=Gregarina niphandrodes TaxID=110365 RepID=A0A023B041_GRENI|nr:putative signal recognition particle 54 kDa protein SRP54 [Gregarina niphandrodes]EZG44859.1 putative signal recognition particle 54 kDa protein SRP54 [Gregarina niphandrodes]|eukprot:XP_011132627.1 putative signal recognition particle 54 kDa protein SRP54 [Gregarina niphandrodes]
MLGALGKNLTEAVNKLNTGNVNEEVIQSFIKSVATALIEADVSIHIVKRVRDNLRTKASTLLDSSKKVASQTVKKTLTRALVEEITAVLTPPTKAYRPVKGRCNVVMFVGLQGVGKTTTVSKYGLYYKNKGFRVGVVCADTYRAGAYDQLKQNAARCRIPFYGDPSLLDSVEIAFQGVKSLQKKAGLDLIVVDTSGRHKQEDSLFQEMIEIQAAVKADACIYVVDAHIGQACYDQAKAFREAVNVASVILTKMDANVKGGGALSAVVATGCPVAFVGLGEGFVDFEPFDVDRFVARLLGIHDPQSLLKIVHEEMGPGSKDAAKRWAKGGMTFEDIRKQLNMMTNVGTMGSMLSSILPGVDSKELLAGGLPDLKVFIALIDAMTPNERTGQVKLCDSRRLRLAKGAGCQLVYVDLLIKLHAGMNKTFSNVGKRIAKAKRMK